MPYTFKYGDRPLEGLTVQRAVGRGGFGEVYYAVTDSGKQVALKYLRENPEIELRGIAHVMNLKSPHLITIYDVKRNPAGEPFVIMEYVSGPSLRELMLNEPGGLGAQKAAYFVAGIAKGLAYLHERGIVHRDLKPANIFYDDGYVKIGDYGLSKHLSVSKHSGQTVSVGTVHYMAPEIGSGNYTKAIDIYALGVILYEMLTGRLPFSGASMGEILMRHLRDNADMSGIPQPFAAVIAKALAKDPKDRFQDANEMLAAIMECGDVGRSIEAFDASMLTQVPRRPDAQDDLTRTSPARPGAAVVPPVLDVRDAGIGGWEQRVNRGLQRVDQRMEQLGQQLPERLRRKLDRLGRKLEQKTQKLEKKFGPRRYPSGARQAAQVAGPAGKPVRRAPQLLLLLLIIAVISVALGAVQGFRDPPESTVVVPGLLLLGGTFGPLLVHLRLLRGRIGANRFFDRLAYASMAALFMAPGAMIGADREETRYLAYLIIAPLAAILLCDWGRRMEAGRRGEVNGRSAIWPAVLGAIAFSCFEPVRGEAPGLLALLLCAAHSLLTQAAASLWPVTYRQSTGIFPDGPVVVVPRPGAAIPAAAGGATPATAPIAEDGAIPATANRAASADAPAAPGATQPVAATAILAPAEAGPAPADFALAQPSFVGRAANAGLAAIGKVLLLAGLVIALGQGVVLAYPKTELRSNRWHVAPEVQQLIEQGVPRGIGLAVVIGGSVFLLAARRRDGVAHFVRGCFGSICLAVAALLAVLGAGPAFETLMTGHPDFTKLSGDSGGLLFFALTSLAAGNILLMWPKPSGRTTIVV